MDEVLDIVSIELPILVDVHSLELFTEEFLVFGELGIEEACDELGVVDLPGVVEVHCREDLLQVGGVEVDVHLLLEKL